MSHTIFTKKYVADYLEGWSKCLDGCKKRGVSEDAIKHCEKMVKYYSDLANNLKKIKKD